MNTSTASTATEPTRLRDALRDNGLATLAMVLVVAVAVAGWSASFISLHGFAMAHMGLTARAAWLVPSTFDGAALGLSLLSFRAAIYGRASLGSALYVYGFTALSSWINWVHIDDHAGGKLVASLLPIAAVLVFGKVLKEAREAFERRHGKRVFKVRPGLLALRWLADRRGTRGAIRTQILDIPVEALIGLGAGDLARQARAASADSAPEVESAPVAAPPVTQSEPVVAESLASQDASATQPAVESEAAHVVSQPVIIRPELITPDDSVFSEVIADIAPSLTHRANGRPKVAAAESAARGPRRVTARVAVDRDEAARIYRESLAAGEPLSSRGLAVRTGMSQSTALRLIAEIRAEDDQAAA